MDERTVFLIGKNGQGKTNFLEGIYLLCFGSSFRTKNEQRLCMHGTNGFSAAGTYETEDGFHSINLRYEDSKKEIKVDENPIRDRKEIIRNVPCIIFGHEDYLFVNGAPERQRYFFDQTLSLYDPIFIDKLRSYKKLLKARNLLLKQQDGVILDVYEEQLAAAGLEIMEARGRLTDEFNQVFTELFSRISGFDEELKMCYSPSWKSEKTGEIRNFLKQKREIDSQFSATTTGPHRDRFKFLLKGKNFVEAASTGQIRLISLILKAAQAVFFRKKTNKKPLLLLDDVLLELDGEKRMSFLKELPEHDQALFTFLPEEPLLDLYAENGRIYSVKNGILSKNA